MASHRLFYALTPGAEARARIAQHGAARPEQLHLTLAFLGDAQPSRALLAGERAAAQAAPFAFALDETDSFHGGTWILRAPAAAFTPLLDALHRHLHACGLRAQDEARPFVAHVTLRRRAPIALPRAAIAPIRWQADALRLYDSDLGSGRHALLGDWPLAGNNDVSP
jgi:2'-5' RNA ligase